MCVGVWVCGCVCLLHLPYPLLLVDGYLECLHILAVVNSAANEHWGVCIFLNYGFLWICAQEWDCWIILSLFQYFIDQGIFAETKAYGQ